MAEEMVLKFRRVANWLYSRNEAIRNTVRSLDPVIIAMKGDPGTGRKLAAFYVASILKCPLIKEHDFDKYEEKTDSSKTMAWRKICNLARSQLTSGHSVVIDTELANPNEFEQLKELSEITNIPLVVIVYRVHDAHKLWNSQELGTNNPSVCIFPEFIEKPTSQYQNSTSYHMGEILPILMKVQGWWNFEWSVSCALQDIRDYIDPNIAFKLTNDCVHSFQFMNIDEECKRSCCHCSQFVWGPVCICNYCRLLVHRTCSYFPESLYMCVLTTEFSMRINTLILKLRHVVPKLDTDATCSCCKQLLIGSTSSQYYSTENGLVLFDLDCLFLLPVKLIKMIHEHELIRGLVCEPLRCNECDTSIDKDTLFYHCYTCKISFDMYCLWLPELAEFDRHKHLFRLSIVPRTDPYPYYCDVCEKERDTERWIYYCALCVFPIHPRCFIEESCPLTFLSKETSTAFKKSMEKLTVNTKSQSWSSHLSTERLMAKELWFQHRHEAEELRLLFKESTKEIELPILITTKGHSYKGRKLVALALAVALDCLLIEENDLCEVTNIANEPKHLCYHEFSRIALSQLQIGLSVVIDCDLSHESEFIILRDLALSTETPLFIVECKPCDEYELEDCHNVIDLSPDHEYDVGNTPKLFVDVATSPTFDDIHKCMQHILHSISVYIGHTEKPDIPTCYRHSVFFGQDWVVGEGDICDRCSKQLSTPIIRCSDCGLVLHKTCTKLPSRLQFELTWAFNLERYGNDNEQVRCNCCNELVKGYAYTYSDDGSFRCLDINCLFTPAIPGTNLHDHRMIVSFTDVDFQCQACGFVCKQRLHYRCGYSYCKFKIGVKCGWLRETVTFDRHRHPFHLAVCPENYFNEYFCDICLAVSPEPWTYRCIGCEFYIHIRCLVPTECCPLP